MEKTTIKQVWSLLIRLCGIILCLVILNVVIVLDDFYSSFHCLVSMFKSFLRIIFSCTWKYPSAATTTAQTPIDIKLPRDQTDETNHGNLSLSDVKKVIQQETSCGYEENLAADKIGGLFEEEGPSLEEVKEAFDVFDENKDGFIDAKELWHVLVSLGFSTEVSEEDCKRMINGFDDDFDGRIDLTEFMKVMETSFCSTN
ncbi:hypothetical protein PTKIN_Ptkin05aG0172600 [Pterospermum kingtungense]